MGSRTLRDAVPDAVATGPAAVRTGLAEAIRVLADEGPIGERLADRAFGEVVDGQGSDAEIAALLLGLRIRGETAAELSGAVRAVRARMVRVEAPAGAVDVCGTGGDGRNSLNVSTAVAFVLRGAGVPVAKHGNVALSSRSGAADVLAALGVDPDPPVERQRELLAGLGLAFLFAQRHHAALRHAAAARRALGIRTLLNLVGPLCNPASVRLQLLGVFDRRWLVPVADALASLGAERAWVVHGSGLDEMTLDGVTEVAILEAGRVRLRTVVPEDAGLERAPSDAIRGGLPARNAAALERLLQGERGAYRDTVLFNAAASLLVAGVADDLREGVARAASAIDAGSAFGFLESLRREIPVPPSGTGASETGPSSTGVSGQGSAGPVPSGPVPSDVVG